MKHPSEVLKEGQEVEVKILSLDKEKGKISLGLKQ
ncbi:S1 RNA-binding domain-containing protein, partial [Vibrio parahaemolyticus]|nr:S1 RNA-binding domain-containing protein [Vibrio parahaemolyticus]